MYVHIIYKLNLHEQLKQSIVACLLYFMQIRAEINAYKIKGKTATYLIQYLPQSQPVLDVDNDSELPDTDA